MRVLQMTALGIHCLLIMALRYKPEVAGSIPDYVIGIFH
jgi:hypothetical protein